MENLTIKGLEATIENYRGFVHPCLKVTNITNGDIGYMMPFRMYKLQICGNKEGDSDKGSTEVELDFLYYIVKHHSPVEAKRLITIEVARCFNSYLNNNYGYTPGRRIAITVNGEIPYTEWMVNWEIPKYGPYDELHDISEIEFVDKFVDDLYYFAVEYYSKRRPA